MLLENKYAIVGAGGVYPDAENLNQYWENIINKVISIKEASSSKFFQGAHYDKNSFGKSDKKDKSYTNLCAEIKEIQFNGFDFKIPPSTSKHLDDSQKVALIATKEALASNSLNEIDRNKVSVVIGNSGYGDLMFDFQRRFFTQRVEYILKNENVFNNLSASHKEKLLQSLETNLLAGTIPVTEDSAPGVLPGILASRINSVFDFHGRAIVVDSACASGLAAISVAKIMLDTHESDAVICGGIDMTFAESGMILYSGINALSPDGSFPFDNRANGFVIGQGGGIVILKRLSDAITNKDSILAVVTSAGCSTDGKGKAIAAPNPIWQAKAIVNAYKNVDYSLDTVEYIEAHGTSTQVGDLSEVTALKTSFSELGVQKKNYCGLSSVKSNIAHLKSAAGMAGFIKAVLAIKNKTLPPVAGFKQLNPKLELEDSPFFVIDEARPWQAKEHPRRAGVSAFGFGGVNYHIALEEYRPEDYKNNSRLSVSEKKEVRVDISTVESTIRPIRKVFKVSAENIAELKSYLLNILKQINEGHSFEQIISKCNLAANSSSNLRLSFAICSKEELSVNLQTIVETIDKEQPLFNLELKGIYFSDKKALKSSEISWVFPGQGAQYAGMLKSLIATFPSVKNTFVRADNIWKSLSGISVSDLLFDKTLETETIEDRLRQTRNTHPAIFTADYAIYNLLKEMGLEADFCIGHSAGELVALTAAGAFSFADGLKVMEARSKAFVKDSPSGKMVALKGNAEYSQELIDKSNIEVWLANMNSPKQTIVSGSADNIEKFKEFCNQEDVNAIPVNVSEAFHSPLVENAGKQFSEFLQSVRFKALHTKVMSNETANFYKTKPEETRNQLSRQITSGVKFTEGIENLYKKGVRLFVEVGPNAILGNNIKNILENKEVSIISTNFKKKDDVETIYRVFSQLFALGIDMEDPAVENETTIESNSLEIAQPSNIEKINHTLSSNNNKRKVVYSGVSVGLPGTFKNAFREDNFQQLFEGKNFIERLTDSERQSIVDLQVRKLIKSEKGASYKDLDTLNDVIQFASKMGQVDFEKDFGFDPKELATMSSSIAHAVAAGYEALKDAHIPLIHQYTRTNTGSVLPEKWALPQHMQKRTGVIFANGFPMVEPVVEEVSRHLSYKLGSKMRKDIFEYYDSLIQNIKDAESRKVLADWYSLNYSKLSEVPSQEEVYVFNHQFMNQISSQANNRLARYLNAQGPNFLILAACSSTATAITLSEEMIQSGRVDRMIIVSADDTANKKTLPYIGAGFLSTGAASNKNDIYEVAIPFDRRRNGMVVGSGAVGIVLEAEDECKKRGVTPVAELVGTHCFNTAGHPSALDIPLYADALENFISKITEEQGLDRNKLASSMVYMSHEPSTPPKGGCSQSEAVALQHVFGEQFRNIIVTNTKGMTGHTMGASIEDATAAKCLQYGKTPPVVNFKEKDPLLEGLRLSVGENHRCEYALRMAAGFGSQGNYILLKKAADGDTRILDENQFKKWLAEVSHQTDPKLEKVGNLLRVVEEDKGKVVAQRPTIPCFHGTTEPKQIASKPLNTFIEKKQSVAVASHQSIKYVEADSTSAQKEILQIVGEVSGYPVEMLELDMEFEADLGIDTVKQATILGILSEKYGILASGDFKIAEYPSPKHLLQLIAPNEREVGQIKKMEPSAKISQTTNSANDEFKDDILKIVSEVSGYPVEMLEPDMEFEADLGIDTVKQATILGILSEKYNVDATGNFKISEYPTPNHLAKLLGNSSGSLEETLFLIDEKPKVRNTELKKEILKIVSEISGYPAEMLEPEMEFEADLGIDTVKQATILGILSEKYNIESNGNFRIAEYPTPNHLVQFIDGFHKNETEASPEINVNNHFSDNKKDVLNIVSEVSGYPVEMLEPEMEFEADLGIDTVKQATILGMLSEKFKIESTGDFKISEYPTIGHLVSLVPALNGISEEKASNDALNHKNEIDIEDNSQSTTEPSINSGSYITDDAISCKNFISFLCQNSDYVEEMLQPEIKWKELFGFDLKLKNEIENKVIAQWKLEKAQFVFSKDDTLQSLTTKISMTRLPEIIENKLPLPSSYALTKQVLSLETVKKGQKKQDISLLNALILVEDSQTEASFRETFKNSFKKLDAAYIGEKDELQEILKKVESKEFYVIIDTSFLMHNLSSNKLEFAKRKSTIEHILSSRFQFIKGINEFETKPQAFVSIVSLDGSFGIDSNTSNINLNPEFGLISGMYKALRKEWNNTRVCILDIGMNWNNSISKKLKEQIEQELAENLPYIEVCYGGGKRRRLVVEDSPLEQPDSSKTITFNSSDTIFVAGGGSGITAEWIKAMASVFKTNFAVVGRTKLNTSALQHKGKNEEEWNQYKLKLRSELIAKGKKATPALVEKEISSIKKSLNILELIENVSNKGCGIKYYSADLQNLSEVKSIVSDIKTEQKNITALVHGAGVEMSHFISQKSEQEFFSVLGSKVFSACALEEALKNEPLKRVFSFSSISGRFGNQAQLDYSAANDFIDVWTRSLNQRGISALSINWSGWDKIGMAVRNSFVKEQAENIGIHLINPEDGAAIAVAEFVHSEEKGNVLLHRGIKPMHENLFFKNDLYNFPFIDRFDVTNTKTTYSHRVFSPKRDLFLDHHRVRGISLMPGVGYLEAMIEHLFILNRKKLPVIFRNLQFLEGCKFHKEEAKELTIEAKPIGEHNFEMRLFNLFKGKIAGLNKEITFCTANVSNEEIDNSFIDRKNWNITGLQEVPYSKANTNSNEFINLGPLLNDMGRNNRTEDANTYHYSKNALVQSSWMPYEQLNNSAYPNNKFIANPCFMDTLHQAGAIFSLLRENAYHLPVGAEEFGIIGIGKTFSKYRTTVKFKKKEGDFIYHDILCQDEEGNACIYIKNSCYRKVNS